MRSTPTCKVLGGIVDRGRGGVSGDGDGGRRQRARRRGQPRSLPGRCGVTMSGSRCPAFSGGYPVDRAAFRHWRTVPAGAFGSLVCKSSTVGGSSSRTQAAGALPRTARAGCVIWACTGKSRENRRERLARVRRVCGGLPRVHNRALRAHAGSRGRVDQSDHCSWTPGARSVGR